MDKKEIVTKLEYYYRMRDSGYFNAEETIKSLETRLLEILKEEYEQMVLAR